MESQKPMLDWLNTLLYRSTLRFCHRSDGRYGFEKIFQAVLCPTQLFQWKLICTFNQPCLSYTISNRLQFNSSLFLNKLFKMLLHWHTFFSTCATRWKQVLIDKNLCICLLLTCIKGKLVLLLDKTGYASQRTRPKFIDSQNLYFHFHCKLFCI